MYLRTIDIENAVRDFNQTQLNEWAGDYLDLNDQDKQELVKCVINHMDADEFHARLNDGLIEKLEIFSESEDSAEGYERLMEKLFLEPSRADIEIGWETLEHHKAIQRQQEFRAEASRICRPMKVSA